MELDRWIERIRSQRDHLIERREVAEVEGTLRTLVAELHDATAARTPVADEYVQAHEEAGALQERCRHLDQMLAGSTAGPRELAALQHEREQVATRLNAAEDRELELLLRFEPLEEAVQAIKQQAQPLVERRASLAATIADLEASLNEEIVALTAKRSDLVVAVAEPWRTQYEQAWRRSGGVGAAQVDGGRCDGCRIALAPLDLDRFKRTSGGDLMPCPECGRLLLP